VNGTVPHEDDAWWVVARAVVPPHGVLLERRYGFDLVWTGEHVLPQRELAFVQDDGHFGFDELCRGAYVVTLEASSRLPADPGVLPREGQRVHAPAADIAFDVECVRVHFDVSAADSGESIREARILVGGAGSPVHLKTGWGGRASILLPPDSERRVRVRAPGYEDQTLSIRARPGHRSIRQPVRLAPLRDPGRVAIRIRDSLDRPNTWVRLSLSDAAGEAVRLARSRSSHTASLPEGTYVLRVRSTVAVSESDVPWELPPTPLLVRAGQCTTYDVVAPRGGGRLELTARGPQALPVEAACTIFDADHRRVPVRFQEWSSLGPEASTHVTYPLAGVIQGPKSRLAGRLAPGWYTVVLENPAFGRAARAVQVRPDETTALDVTLR
jgi:hypothetical protein